MQHNSSGKQILANIRKMNLTKKEGLRTTTTPIKSNSTAKAARYKDSEHKHKKATQRDFVLEYFLLNTGTRKMASKRIGMRRCSICPIVFELKKEGLLKVAFKAHCKSTGFKAEFLTSTHKFYQLKFDFLS